MNVPTHTIRNKKGETRVVNQYDYHSKMSMCFGGEWEIIQSDNRGLKEGFEAGKENTELVRGLAKKRLTNPLKKPKTSPIIIL